jgi:adenosylhomocysteine nucleosidase
MAAEARIARRLGHPVAIGGGSAAGARTAALRLAAEGATALLSFGLAGGLDAGLRPGDLIVPEAVLAAGEVVPTSAPLSRVFGGATSQRLLGAEAVIATTEAKRRAWVETGCVAADLESGAVALVAKATGLRFAVLRAVCDPAGDDLPPVVLTALAADGSVRLALVLVELIRSPRQLPAMVALARHAGAARRALVGRLRTVQPVLPRLPDG